MAEQPTGDGAPNIAGAEKRGGVASRVFPIVIVLGALAAGLVARDLQTVAPASNMTGHSCAGRTCPGSMRFDQGYDGDRALEQMHCAALTPASATVSKATQQIVKDQVSACRAGNWGEALQDSTRQYQAMTPCALHSLLHERAPQVGNPENKVSFGKPQETKAGNVATLPVTFTAKNGTPTQVTYYLLREDGKWRVDGLRSADARIGGMRTAFRP